MRYWIVATLVTISWIGSVEAEDAKQFFDSVYGSRLRLVKATADRADDLAFAKEMLATAQTIERADALALMCDNVVELSQRHPDGLSTAIDALRLIEDKVETRRAEARKKLVELLTRQSSAGSADVRQKAGDGLISLLVQQGDDAAKAKLYDEAQVSYRQALATAQRLKSPEIDSVKAKMESAGNRGRAERQITRFREKLLADANDSASADEIVRLYVVDLDSPTEAMKHIERAKNPRLKKMVPLAAEPLESVNEADSLALGEWYLELAAPAAAPAKENLWRRASAYLTRYLGSQPTDELARTKAELLLRTVPTSVAKAGPGQGQKPENPDVHHPLKKSQPDEESWISQDATYTVGGSELAGHPPRPGLLTGGKNLDGDQYAFHTKDATPGGYIVIDLGRTKTISRIWIENRRMDNQSRAKGMTLALSAQSNEIPKPIWTAEKVENDWTIQLPQKVKARYITIRQAVNSPNALHLAQVKILGWDK